LAKKWKNSKQKQFVGILFIQWTDA
jgi:hypothetical protein